MRLGDAYGGARQTALRNCKKTFALREAFGYAALTSLEDDLMNPVQRSSVKKSWSTPSIEDFAVGDLTQTGGDEIQDGTAKTDETPASS